MLIMGTPQLFYFYIECQFVIHIVKLYIPCLRHESM